VLETTGVNVYRRGIINLSWKSLDKFDFAYTISWDRQSVSPGRDWITDLARDVKRVILSAHDHPKELNYFQN
jgi:hypothetical protein